MSFQMPALRGWFLDETGRFRMESFNLSRGYRFHVAKEGCRTEMRDVEAGLQGRSRDGVLNQGRGPLAGEPERSAARRVGARPDGRLAPL